MFPIEGVEWPYLHRLCASDAVITKPGYGTFAGCACNGVSALYGRRRDWPEEPYLSEWLEANARCTELPRVALQQGAVGDPLRALWAAAPVPATGGDQAAVRRAELPA